MTIRAVYRNENNAAIHATTLADGRYVIVDKREAVRAPLQVDGNKVTFAKYPSEVRERKRFTGAVLEPEDHGIVWEARVDKVVFRIERQDEPLDIGEGRFPNADRFHRYHISKES